MPDQKPIRQEAPKTVDAQNEKFDAKNENPEILEKEAESESKKEERLIDELAELRAKMGSAAFASSGAVAVIDEDIEQRKERIIKKFIKAARATNFSDQEVGRIMDIAKRYIRKEHPDIADAIHDRILEERNRGGG